MKAFYIDRYSKKSSLQSGEMPEPELRDHDVLVEIHATSVNPLDPKIRDGEFKLILPFKLPLILGNDLSDICSYALLSTRSFRKRPLTVFS